MSCEECGAMTNRHASYCPYYEGPPEVIDLREEVARLRAEVSQLHSKLAHASDPMNWEAMWTGDAALGWQITHGNLIEIDHGQGQALFRMRPPPDERP